MQENRSRLLLTEVPALSSDAAYVHKRLLDCALYFIRQQISSCFKMLQFTPSTHDALTIFFCESGLFILFNDILGLLSVIRD
jgi:hypothetical protein